MKTITNDTEKRAKAAHEAIRDLVRDALENYPKDHRTGCVTSILRTVAEVLMNEKGWTSRQAADAMVMEGVRAGGELERKAVQS